MAVPGVLASRGRGFQRLRREGSGRLLILPSHDPVTWGCFCRATFPSLELSQMPWPLVHTVTSQQPLHPTSLQVWGSWTRVLAEDRRESPLTELVSGAAASGGGWAGWLLPTGLSAGHSSHPSQACQPPWPGPAGKRRVGQPCQAGGSAAASVWDTLSFPGPASSAAQCLCCPQALGGAGRGEGAVSPARDVHSWSQPRPLPP